MAEWSAIASNVLLHFPLVTVIIAELRHPQQLSENLVLNQWWSVVMIEISSQSPGGSNFLVIFVEFFLAWPPFYAMFNFTVLDLNGVPFFCNLFLLFQTKADYWAYSISQYFIEETCKPSFLHLGDRNYCNVKAGISNGLNLKACRLPVTVICVTSFLRSELMMRGTCWADIAVEDQRLEVMRRGKDSVVSQQVLNVCNYNCLKTLL